MTETQQRNKMKEIVEKVVGENGSDHWMNTKWRPFMAWKYAAVCIFDFIVAPILWGILQIILHVGAPIAWVPLTLQGAGLYHLAMGAILGVAAWTRSKEKMGSLDALNNLSTTLNNNEGSADK